MRNPLLLASIVMTFVVGFSASPGVAQVRKTSETMLNTTVYRLQVRRPVDAAGSFQSAADLRRDLVRMQKANLLVSVDTIQVRALDGVPARAQVGRQEPVVTGEQVRGGVRTRTISMQETGTLLKLISREHGDQVYVDLEYDATFPVEIAPAGDDDDRPQYERRSITTITVLTTLLAKFGEVSLIHNQQTESGGVLVYAQIVRGAGASSRSPASSSASSATAPTPQPRDKPRGIEPAESIISRAMEYFLTNARRAAERGDRNKDGKLSRNEMIASGVLRRVRDRHTPKLGIDDVMTIDEAAQGLLRIGSYGGSREGKERETGMFVRRADTNKDGKISSDEFNESRLLRHVIDRRLPDRDPNIPLRVDVVVKEHMADFYSSILNRVARARAGNVTRTTLSQKMAEAMLTRFDADKDGAVSREEAEGTTMQRVFEDDTDWDTNNDDKLSPEEYIALRQRLVESRPTRSGDTRNSQNGGEKEE